MEILRIDVFKNAPKPFADGETAQQKISRRASGKENEQPSEEWQLPVDHPTAVSGGSRRHIFAFTYLM